MTRVDLALLSLLTLATLAPKSALAQSAEAESLFREGRRLIKAGKLEAGCDKIEASNKLEPSVGTLLNLGDCREKLGMTASAWAAFRKAEGMAKVRGDAKRRNEASKRAILLEPKLPQLVITVSSRVDGLVIKRDNEAIDPAQWNTPMPIDPDTYTIVAEAPGYKPWRTEITVDNKLKRRVVSVPTLERDPVAVKPPEKLGPTEFPVASAPPQSPPIERPRDVVRRERSMWTTSRKVALGVGIAGVAAAGTGVYFGLRSRDLESQSNEICPSATCDDPGALRLNDRAQTAARNANILYGVGGVALATGVVLWLVGSPSDERVVKPEVGRDYAGASFGGTF